MKEINLKVDGMVCNGCENRVKNALENIIANHESNRVSVTLKEEIEESIIINKIEDLGYKVIKGDTIFMGNNEYYL